MIRYLIATITLLLLNLFCIAQSTSPQSVDMADTMRSNGKIFVVIAVILTIFTGLVLYLIRLDRKISKLEKADASPAFSEKS